MKLFTTKEGNFSIQVLNEREEHVGELLFGVINGLNERIKIGSEIYKIEGTGFLWKDIRVLDESGKVVLIIDSSKNRLFYYGNSTEIYTYQFKSWLHKELLLYDSQDKLVLALSYKQTLLKLKYVLEIDEDFNHDLIILSFLNFYLRDVLNG
ncbi:MULTISPECIES: hypothetical protein [Chryseobacterium]|uniref:Uncharacterized protein n=1 Tax=Chryseobacterium pennae TaxID=2258962 RepID=A0A3D9C5B1_9FLAO|nr:MULTISPECIES: hypothetical protein [Chryseobacterium]MCS4300775.1 hypothetical protein [Chryseobacterium sp. BIGb0232]REC60939.1 hypothetical protein DRF65_18040 [Chryseobacterium pennae]ROS20345.1 hypothetical protein EDF65_1062 [Chryseobacterium nakagawai]